MRLAKGAEAGFCARVIADMLHDADINMSAVSASDRDLIYAFYANLFFGGILCMNGRAGDLITLYEETIEALKLANGNFYAQDYSAAQSQEWTGGITIDMWSGIPGQTPYTATEKIVVTIFNLFDTGAGRYPNCTRGFVPYAPAAHWRVCDKLDEKSKRSIAHCRTHALVTDCKLGGAGRREVTTHDGIVLLRLDVENNGAYTFALTIPQIKRGRGFELNKITARAERRCEITERQVVRDLVEIFNEFKRDPKAGPTRAGIMPGRRPLTLWPYAKDVTDPANFLSTMEMMYTEHMFKFWGDFGQIMGAIENGAAVGTVDKSMISICLYLGVPVATTATTVKKSAQKYTLA